MLVVAIAFFLLATLPATVVATRAAWRLSRRAARLRDAIETGTALAVRAQGLRARATRVRDDSERLRALAQIFS